MRLLEFGRDEGGANPLPANKAAGTGPTPIPVTEPPAPSQPALPASRTARRRKQAKVFPINPGNGVRKPVDLEQLQQRVTVLEQRIKARTEALGDEVTRRDLEQLKQRMKLLERSISNELWSARQREYNMLQVLAKPTLKQALRQQLRQWQRTGLPALRTWLSEGWAHWWRNSQPHWWAAVARAWQESLDRARGQTPR
jgi:hypothetical protein